VIRRLDIVDELAAVDVPTLILVGELDPVTPIAAAEEVVAALPDGVAQLRVLAGAGHFSWKDVPEPFFQTISEFVRSTVGRERVA
jgi:pimeloyl-ACP methyl ester carboxylesterase